MTRDVADLPTTRNDCCIFNSGKQKERVLSEGYTFYLKSYIKSFNANKLRGVLFEGGNTFTGYHVGN